MIRQIMRLTVAVILSAVFTGCEKTPGESAQGSQSSAFTTAIAIELPGCGNLYQVADGLYRGKQPTAEGFRELEKLGIKTVVNLRSLHSDQDELKGTELGYEHIRMEAWDPEPEEIEQFLAIATDPAKQPVFVHCQHGADRTGTMIAVYRIVVESWDVDKAIDEMRNGPFGFHEIWAGLPKFIEELDVERLRQNFGPTQ